MLKTYERTHFAIVSVCKDTASLCNGYVAYKKDVCKYFMNENVQFCFRFSHSPIFTKKGVMFLDDKKISAHCQGLLSQ